MLYKQDHQLTLTYLCPKGIVKSYQLLCEQENYRTLITFFFFLNKFTFYSLSPYYVSSNSPVISSLPSVSHSLLTPQHHPACLPWACMEGLHALPCWACLPSSSSSVPSVHSHPSHTHRALHQIPCTPIIYQLSPTTALLIAP